MKVRYWIMLATVCLLTVPTARAVGTGASAAVLMEMETGRVLYEYNSHQPRLIASTTKLMTALVALESGRDLHAPIKVLPEWTGIEGSSVYLQPGEEITLESLLYGMLLRSGNDAAAAVAGCCGGQEEFTAAMNRKARELGMENSRFENPSGLDGTDHRSSAYDMALLARACLENEGLAKIVATKSITLGTRTYTNHNKLLWRYEGCIGLKTGYTEKAGRTLVSAARREGMTLICVTLNDPDDWADHAALFDYGFSAVSMEMTAKAGERVGALPVEGSLFPICPVVAKEDLKLCLHPGEETEREVVLDVPQLSAPVPAGTQVGRLVFRVDGAEMGSVPLVTGMELPDHRAGTQSLLDRLLKAG